MQIMETTIPHRQISVQKNLHTCMVLVKRRYKEIDYSIKLTSSGPYTYVCISPLIIKLCLGSYLEYSHV